VSNSPSYLPVDLASELPMLLVEIGVVDSDAHWRVARLVERAFADGYRAGYSRAISDRSLLEVSVEQRDRATAEPGR
jgi:hypothetical protein